MGRKLALFFECGLTAVLTLVYGEKGRMDGFTQHGQTGPLTRRASLVLRELKINAAAW